MPSIGTNSKPAYVYDSGTDTWIPIGPGEHTHDYIGKDVITTTGDIIYASAANTPARRGIGSTGQVLGVSSGVPSWVAQPNGIGALVSDTTNDHTIPNNTSTILNFPNERFDTDGFHSTTTNTSRLTIPTGLAGYYYIYGWGMWTNTALTSVSLLRILLNGSTHIAEVRMPKRVSDWTSMLVFTSRNLSVGDYVELQAYQDSGGNMPFSTGSSYGSFGLYRMGA